MSRLALKTIGLQSMSLTSSSSFIEVRRSANGIALIYARECLSSRPTLLWLTNSVVIYIPADEPGAWQTGNQIAQLLVDDKERKPSAVRWLRDAAWCRVRLSDEMTSIPNDNLTLWHRQQSQGPRYHDNGFPSYSNQPTLHNLVTCSHPRLLSVHPLDNRRIVYQGTRNGWARCFYHWDNSGR